MKDEEYLFFCDTREKKDIARSARNKRTHNGKGGRVRLPSDHLTKKELNAMNGEVKSYRLNDPMKWAEFKAMPDDIKITYIKLLREKFNCFDMAIAEMLGVNKCTFSVEIKRLGLGHGAKHGGYRTWNEREAFYAWVYGITSEEVQVDEEPETASQEVIEPDTVPEEVACSEDRNAIPESGNMTFEGSVEDILKTVGILLGGAKVHISITWDVLS